MKLVTAARMGELDRRTIEEIGIPGAVLMENAGRGVVAEILRRYRHLFPGPVLVLAGKGNNGGDGYVIARHLRERSWQVRTIVLAEPAAVTGDARLNLQVLTGTGGQVDYAPDGQSLQKLLGAAGEVALAVDALFGTGLSSPVRGHYATAIDWLNGCGRPVVAVDIPSGVAASSGRELGVAVRAELTVTFAFAKLGHAVYPGAGCTGALALADIGIPRCLAETVDARDLLVEAAEAAALLPARPAAGHKGTFGHLLVVAGSTGKAGAAAMTAMGGLRSGAGLVTVAAPQEVQRALQIKLTEAMTEPLPGSAVLGRAALEPLCRLWEGKDALAVGPGLGQAEETRDLVQQLVGECPLPLVLDADGLNAVAAAPQVLTGRSAGTVLTPHPGEMARLSGRSIAEVEADRLETARVFARRFGVVLVLKGARTVTAFPDGRVRINGSGNPGLASGGMGDVLTGLIGALLAQGLCPEDAAVLGVFLHGYAADRLAERLGEAGMIAGDLLTELPAARRALREEGVLDAES